MYIFRLLFLTMQILFISLRNSFSCKNIKTAKLENGGSVCPKTTVVLIILGTLLLSTDLRNFELDSR